VLQELAAANLLVFASLGQSKAFDPYGAHPADAGGAAHRFCLSPDRSNEGPHEQHDFVSRVGDGERSDGNDDEGTAIAGRLTDQLQMFSPLASARMPNDESGPYDGRRAWEWKR